MERFDWLYCGGVFPPPLTKEKAGDFLKPCYTYGNTKWMDLLTGFNDEPILYEGQTLVDGVITGDPTSGNPISYYNGTRWEFVWQNGRQLSNASTTVGDTDVSIAYTYDINGLRTSKTITRTTITNDDEDEGGEVQDCTHNWVEIGRTQYIITYQCSICSATYEEPIQQQEEFSLRSTTVTTERHDYIYASGQLLRETITTTDAEGNVAIEVLDFTYDASGSPYTLTYNGTTYYYVVNLQGDIIRVVNASGMTVAEYAYDPWGRVISATGEMAEVNPLRYRGYYHDTDTGFYYLQSRYYDPTICRFVNADTFASTGQDFLGFNMFAYCGNSPINRCDPTGEFFFTVLGAVIGAVVGAVDAALDPNATAADIWKGAAAGAASGAISGAGVDIAVIVTASTGGAGLAAGVAIAGTFGVAGSVVGTGISTDWSAHPLEYAVSGLIGGIFNIISFGLAPINGEIVKGSFKQVVSSLINEGVKDVAMNVASGVIVAACGTLAIRVATGNFSFSSNEVQ